MQRQTEKTQRYKDTGIQRQTDIERQFRRQTHTPTETEQKVAQKIETERPTEIERTDRLSHTEE